MVRRMLAAWRVEEPFKVRVWDRQKFSAFLQHNECGRDQIIKSGHIQGHGGCHVLNNVGASVYNIRPFQGLASLVRISRNAEFLVIPDTRILCIAAKIHLDLKNAYAGPRLLQAVVP